MQQTTIGGGVMTLKQEIFKRWIDLLRLKASEYEHAARHAGDSVSEPCIDSICNEMRAYLAGGDDTTNNHPNRK